MTNNYSIFFQAKSFCLRIGLRFLLFVVAIFVVHVDMANLQNFAIQQKKA